MRGARSTLVMLVLFLALGGYAYFVESERPPASEADANEQAFGFEEDDITELRVVADNGDVTSVARTAGDDGSWSINSPVEVDADDNAASSIVSGLASLEIQRVVEAEPSDLTAFGLSDPAIDVGFRTADDAVLRHLLIGDATPTGADRYAKDRWPRPRLPRRQPPRIDVQPDHVRPPGQDRARLRGAGCRPTRARH